MPTPVLRSKILALGIKRDHKDLCPKCQNEHLTLAAVGFKGSPLFSNEGFVRDVYVCPDCGESVFADWIEYEYAQNN